MSALDDQVGLLVTAVDELIEANAIAQVRLDAAVAAAESASAAALERWQGAYNGALGYDALDIVSYAGSSYIAGAPVAAGQTPGVHASWELLGQKGDTGAQGVTGETGATGAAGSIAFADINALTALPGAELASADIIIFGDVSASQSKKVAFSDLITNLAASLATAFTALVLTGGTVSASTPLFSATQNWNNAAVTFKAIDINVTDTASASASLLMDLQVGGASQFNVTKAGRAAATRWASAGAPDSVWMEQTAVGVTHFYGFGGPWLSITNGGNTLAAIDRAFGWRSSSEAGITADLFLTRKAAASLRLGAADAAAPVAQTLGVQSVVAGTTNTAGVDFTIAGSQGTGTGAGGSLVFQVAPAGSTGSTPNALVTALTIASDRTAIFASTLSTGNSSGFNSVGLNMRFGNGIGAVIQVNGAAIASSLGTYFAVNSLALSSNAGNSSPDLFLLRDAANTLALRNGANAQTFRTYGTLTDASNYRRLAMAMSTAGVAELKPEGAGTGASGNVLHISGLPTSNPGPGILWNNAGTPAIGT